ncbi:MAG: nitroreductase family protein [Candidatus Hadarchaeales archaeon]
MDVLKAIKERRSIRKYLPKEVEEEKLRELLEAARWAPSWANTQCWEFIVVKEPSTKEKLSETLPPGNPAREAVRTAPVVLVACGRTGVSGFYKGKPVTDKGDFYLFDVALALQNLCLAAHALGLGTVHVGYFDSVAVERLLGVPEGVRVVELVPIGYPAEEPKAPRRKELSEFVYWEKYGQRK